MSSPNAQNTRQHGSAGGTSGRASGPLSAEDTRALILRSRAISESEARLAAAIGDSAPHGRPQAQEDAFSLPPRTTAVDPAEKI
jgi:hypothetical protein